MSSSVSSEVTSSAVPSSEASSSEAVSSSAEAPAVAENKLPASGLSGDTAIAAPGNAAEGFGFVGVWAKDAAGCAQIDQPGAADFAVITTSTFRNGPSACYGNFGAMKDGKASLTVGCATGEQTVTLEQSSPDALTVNGTALVRCKP